MKALIVDDEPLAAKYLDKLIQQNCILIKEVDIFNNPLDALDLDFSEYDLLFLDVKMPNINGFEFIERANLPSNLPIIFTTAHEDYAIDAFKVNAMDYLVKPVEELSLLKAVNKVIKSREKTVSKSKVNAILKVYENNEYILINSESIIHLSAAGSYTNVVTDDKTYVLSKRLSVVADSVKSDALIRVHKSHYVNIKKIEKMGRSKPFYVVMNNNDTIPVSANLKKELEDKLEI